MTFLPCAVIPSRNHHLAVPAILARLGEFGLPVIIVDDGSDEPARTALAALEGAEVEVLRLPANRGKGGAMQAGFARAAERGHTHALQIDADGQHDVEAVPQMLALARQYPNRVIAGEPVFDGSMPMGRRIGRWITHVWVWIETLSTDIRDSMCGFRLYPLAPAIRVMEEETVGARMDFDTEILVRLYWRGVDVQGVPVKVIYPPGNTSNFDLLADNVRITRMHTRLVVGLLARLLTGGGVRNPDAGQHWAALSERGLGAGLALLAAFYRVLGRDFARGLGQLVAGYFCLTNRTRRQASLDYLNRVLERPATLRDSLRHHAAFARMAVDRFAGWTAPKTLPPIDFPQKPDLDREMAAGKGALLLVSHLGNIDITRAVLHQPEGPRITVLVHTRHAQRFTRLIARRNPRFAADMVEVTEVGIDTAMLLQERIARGEWIAIAADRTPVDGDQRTVNVPFLGADAPFSTGPYLLASLLGCPVWAMFCIAEGERYRVHLHPFAERITLSRRDRITGLRDWAGRYAALLERHCRRAPFEWFNFYDFWRGTAARPESRGKA